MVSGSVVEHKDRQAGRQAERHGMAWDGMGWRTIDATSCCVVRKEVRKYISTQVPGRSCCGRACTATILVDVTCGGSSYRGHGHICWAGVAVIVATHTATLSWSCDVCVSMCVVVRLAAAAQLRLPRACVCGGVGCGAHRAHYSVPRRPTPRGGASLPYP